MEETMAKQPVTQAKGLPEIPDFPTSPLPAWKHYGILKVLEGRFRAELESVPYDGHLVGLGITYTVGGDPYTMEYGYGADAPQNIINNQSDPLSDDFVGDMYDLANDLIAEHISPYVLSFELQINASVNPQVASVAVKCQIANDANCGKASCKGQCRRFISRNNGPWICTHKRGTCKCS
jgi:hypothetical protein